MYRQIDIFVQQVLPIQLESLKAIFSKNKSWYGLCYFHPNPSPVNTDPQMLGGGVATNVPLLSGECRCEEGWTGPLCDIPECAPGCNGICRYYIFYNLVLSLVSLRTRGTFIKIWLITKQQFSSNNFDLQDGTLV